MSVYDRYGSRDEPDGPTRWSKDLDTLGYDDPQLVIDEINRLFRHYGLAIDLGDLKNAPCNSWRAERLQLENRPYRE
jgi:hypothetical protein